MMAVGGAVVRYRIDEYDYAAALMAARPDNRPERYHLHTKSADCALTPYFALPRQGVGYANDRCA